MKDNLNNFDYNLLLRGPEMELWKFCHEVLEPGEKHPEILNAIERDQDARGELKKLLREADHRHALGKNSAPTSNR